MNLHKHQLYVLKPTIVNHFKFGQQLLGLTVRVNPDYEIQPRFKLWHHQLFQSTHVVTFMEDTETLY